MERLQWEHMKLARSRTDLKMVRHSFEDRDMTRTEDYNKISQTINAVEDLMWHVESELRFEKRMSSGN